MAIVYDGTFRGAYVRVMGPGMPDVPERGSDQYVESLAADLYWAAEQWFRKVDPYHACRPLWFALANEYKGVYREMAERLIREDTERGRS
jgi:hypothetical protein